MKQYPSIPHINDTKQILNLDKLKQKYGSTWEQYV